MELTERQKWFRSLPLKITETGPHKFERACDRCSVKFQYPFENGKLFADLTFHFFYHQGMTLVETFTPLSRGEYDFNLPIKFSRAGFVSFIEDFGLFAADFSEFDDPIQFERDFYVSEIGDIFAFHKTYANNPIKSDYQGIFVIFDPSMSYIE